MHSLGVVGVPCSAARYSACRLVRAAQLGQRRRGVDAGVQIARFDFQALAKLLQGLRPLAALGQGHAQAIVGQPISREVQSTAWLQRVTLSCQKYACDQATTPRTARTTSAAAPA